MNPPVPADYDQHKQQLLSDPSTSFALRSRIEQDAQRDPVDALADAQALLDLQMARYANIVRANAHLLPNDGDGMLWGVYGKSDSV